MKHAKTAREIADEHNASMRSIQWEIDTYSASGEYSVGIVSPSANDIKTLKDSGYRVTRAPLWRRLFTCSDYEITW